ncbi:hypothetical protein V1477_015292 [Vespula maculifrons]|uniref:Uncharacterized protein n=1 Tax=Vespula maculifrons TaxID=7453 RepID=A0ABD2BJV9_VESMC
MRCRLSQWETAKATRDSSSWCQHLWPVHSPDRPAARTPVCRKEIFVYLSEEKRRCACESRYQSTHLVPIGKYTNIIR